MEILRTIADNPALLDALEKVLKDKFSLDSISLWTNGNIGFEDKRLGEIVRSRLEGMKHIDEALTEIKKYKTGAAAQPLINRAR